MYTVTKRMEIAGSHRLNLSYESKCENLHGHNWIIVVTIQAKKLNQDGMVADFTDIKKKVHDKLDHKNLNDLFDFNPTAENIAFWISEQLNLDFGRFMYDRGQRCTKVEVQESEGNIAIWEADK